MLQILPSRALAVLEEVDGEDLHDKAVHRSCGCTQLEPELR